MTREQIELKYDEFFGKGYWEEQYKKHIVEFAFQCSNGGKPIVSGSLPPFPDDERIAVESITQGSKEVGIGAISQVYFRKGAKWMRGQLGGNDR